MSHIKEPCLTLERDLLTRLPPSAPQGELRAALSEVLSSPSFAGKFVIGLQLRFTEVSCLVNHPRVFTGKFVIGLQLRFTEVSCLVIPVYLIPMN